MTEGLQVRAIIRKCGGKARVAAHVGIKPHGVYRWCRNGVPPEYWSALAFLSGVSLKEISEANLEFPKQPGCRRLKRFEDRFDDKVLPEPNSGCWLWMGAISVDGYGHIRTRRGMEKAHRISYERSRGPIPEGKVIDHLCRVRCCVNPDHLEVVDTAENIRRGNAGHNLPAMNKERARLYWVTRRAA